MSNKVSYLFTMQDRFSRVADKISKKTHRMRARFRLLRRSVRKASISFKKSAKRFISGFAGMASAAAAFFAIRGFLTVGSRFQDSLADLSAITGAAGEDLNKLQDNILRLARSSSTSADEVAEAFKLVASAKPELLSNLDALTATTEQVLLLKNAAGIELSEAANIAAQGLNIFGKGADQASRFVNVLAAGAKLGSSEIRDTGEAMLIAGPAARAAGLSFEQLNAAIQATAKGGIKGARAGTALNAIFGRLQRAGIDFQKLGLQGSFEIIKKKMDSLTSSTDRALFASQIFGEEHSKVGFALMDNVQLLSQYEKSLAGTNIAQEQANIRLATFSAKARRMGVIFKEAVIRAFLRLEPVLTKLVVDMAKFFEGIKPEQIAAFADGLGTLIEFGKSLATVFGFVFDVVKGIGTMIGEIAAAIATLNFSSFTDTAKTAMAFVTRAVSPVAALTSMVVSPSAVAMGSSGEEIKPTGGAQTSRTDVNVNLNAPAGVVESVKTKTAGSVSGMNVGVNMAASL